MRRRGNRDGGRKIPGIVATPVTDGVARRAARPKKVLRRRSTPRRSAARNAYVMGMSGIFGCGSSALLNSRASLSNGDGDGRFGASLRNRPVPCAARFSCRCAWWQKCCCLSTRGGAKRAASRKRASRGNVGRESQLGMAPLPRHRRRVSRREGHRPRGSLGGALVEPDVAAVRARS